MFCLSLSLSVVAMVTQPGMDTVATYLRGTVVLVAVIVVATLLYVGIFHFGAHPTRIVYLGTYLVVLAGAIAIMAWYRHSRRGPSSAADRLAHR
ncbi:MAG: hypothetical protein JO325_16795, partial [Solirubrobacterales bacterium]|nr:hypothetical protein [Solirubrobacterales bacterium]